MDRRTVLQSLIAAVSFAAVGNQSSVDAKKEGLLVHFDENRNRAGFTNGGPFLVSGRDNGGALSITGPQRLITAAELESTPSSSPAAYRAGNIPLHVHYEQDEYWYTIGGQGVIHVGDQKFNVKAGDLVMGPRGVPHAPHGHGHWHVVTMWQPAGTMEEFFHELEEEKRKAGGKLPPPDEFAALFARHGMKIVGPPPE